MAAPSEFYHEAKYRGLLPQKLERQLAALVRRVLEIDGRESVYLNENDRLVKAQIARLERIALVEADKRVDCYLIELNDDAAFRLRRRMFGYKIDDLGALRLEDSGPPDLWYNTAVSELTQRLDRRG